MSVVTKPLRCLIVEDAEDDAVLVLRQLRTGNYDVTWERVDTPEAMRAALDRQPWDLVLADYKMPRFSGLAALELLRASGLDLPFIMVSGTMGEDQAVAAMKAGADDYLMKGRLAHLVVAVERELRNAAERRERNQVAAELQLSQQRLSLHVEQTPLAVIEFDLTGRVQQWNPAAVATFGFSREEAIGQNWTFIVPAAIHGQLDGVWAAIVSQRGGNRSTNENVTKDGRTIHCEWFNTPLVGPDGRTIGVASSIQDVSERKQAETRTAEQLDELRRWHDALLGREGRVLEVKKEVNALRARLGEPPSYPSAVEGSEP
jgi:PAS domain S-box-containing protein